MPCCSIKRNQSGRETLWLLPVSGSNCTLICRRRFFHSAAVRRPPNTSPPGLRCTDLYYPEEQFTQDKLNECLEPRIFEIGNTKAIDLPLGDAPTARQCTPLSEQKIDSLYPERPFSTQNPFAHYLIVGILFLILLCLSMPAFITWIKNECLCVNTKTILALGLIAGAVLVIFAGLIYLASSEEPFYWLEGVSIWPTEIIRFAAFLLALALLRNGWRKLKNRESELTRDYFREDDLSLGDGGKQADVQSTQPAVEGGIADFLSKCKRFLKLLFYECSYRKEWIE